MLIEWRQTSSTHSKHSSSARERSYRTYHTSARRSSTSSRSCRSHSHLLKWQSKTFSARTLHLSRRQRMVQRQYRSHLQQSKTSMQSSCHSQESSSPQYQSFQRIQLVLNEAAKNVSSVTESMNAANKKATKAQTVYDNFTSILGSAVLFSSASINDASCLLLDSRLTDELTISCCRAWHTRSVSFIYELWTREWRCVQCFPLKLENSFDS